MKKNTILKALAMALCLATLLVCFASCGDDTTTTTESAGTEQTETTEKTTTEEVTTAKEFVNPPKADKANNELPIV